MQLLKKKELEKFENWTVEVDGTQYAFHENRMSEPPSKKSNLCISTCPSQIKKTICYDGPSNFIHSSCLRELKMFV